MTDETEPRGITWAELPDGQSFSEVEDDVTHATVDEWLAEHPAEREE